MKPDPIPSRFNCTLLFEFDITERQLMAMANAIPADKYRWRPDATVRSISEVMVHVAAGIFYLLDLAGHAAPADLYGRVTTAEGEERWQPLARRNDDLEKTLTDKDSVVALLTRALKVARDAINQTDEAALAEPLTRRAYMRMIAHTHEHMGQMIAYTRMIGLRVPWPDWRPDRRSK